MCVCVWEWGHLNVRGRCGHWKLSQKIVGSDSFEKRLQLEHMRGRGMCVEVGAFE